MKTLYPEAKETDIQKYGTRIRADGTSSKGFGIWIEGYGKHAEQVPAWEYPKLALFYRLLTALTAMKHNLDIEDAYRALSVELPKRLGHRVPKPEEIHEIERTVNELVREGMLPERAKEDVIDLAEELSQIVYEVFPNKESLLEHDKNIVKQIRKDKSWGVKGKNLGAYWYEVVLEDVLKKHSEKITQIMKRGIAQPSTPPPAKTKIITKKEPALEDVAIESLKRMGVDLKLETGNIPERKSKIFSWLVQNGLIRVEEENGKPVVGVTEELNRIVGKVGTKSAAAMIKWAAEEGATKEHVEPVAKILGALEELRQVAKRNDPALAKALEKVMKSKHTVRELLHVSVGLISVEELSERWKDEFGLSLIELLRKSPGLTRAFIESMENLRELVSHEVPVEWVPLLKMLDGKPSREELERALERATLLRMVFSAYESLAIRGLPENGGDITKRMLDILERVKVMVPSADITDELRAELQVLSKVTALMKDETYIEAIEEEVTRIVAKIPETRKVRLFKRESPRRKVEDFVAVLMEGNLSEEEAEEKGEGLERYLRDYLDEKEAKELVNNLMIPFRARLLLKRYGTAEDFLFDYAHSKASRLLLLEARLTETLHAREIPHDSILRTMAGAPSLPGRKRITLRGFERNRETLKRLLG